MVNFSIKNNSHIKLFKETNNKFLIIFLALVICFFELIGISLIFPIISLLFGLETNNELYNHFKNFLGDKDISENFVVFLFIFIVILKALTFLLFKYVTTISSNNILFNIRKKVLEVSYRENFSFVSSNLSKLINALNQQTQSISSAITNQYNIIINFFKLISLTLFFVFISIKFFVLIAFTSVIVMFLFQKLIKMAKNYGKNLALIQENYYLETNQIFKNYQHIKFSHKFNKSIFKVLRLIKNYNLNNLKFVLINRGTQIFSEPLILALLVINLFLATKYFEMDLVILTVLFATIIKSYASFIKLIENIQGYKKDFESFKYLEDLIFDYKKPQINKGINFEKLNDLIKCKNLSLEINGINVIKGKNFEFKKNSLTLIKGRSGSGKTSVLNCISGLYKVSSNQIFFDNIDFNKINIYSLRKKMGYVFQENFFFKGTIKENLEFTEKKLNEENIQNYIKLLNLEKLIQNNKIIDENSSNISVGERQRLGILREILKSPDILLLDEITSSVDSNSTKLIIDFLNEIKKNKTIVAVSHQADFDNIADKVYNI